MLIAVLVHGVRRSIGDGQGNSIEVTYDTAQVSLSAQGDAGFSGSLGPIASPCANPLFLIRIAQPAGVFGRWIATGAVRSVGHNSFLDEPKGHED